MSRSPAVMPPSSHSPALYLDVPVKGNAPKKPKKEKKRRLSPLRRLLAVLLSVLLFFSLLSASALLLARITFSRGNLERWIGNMQWRQLLTDITAEEPVRSGTLLLSLSDGAPVLPEELPTELPTEAPSGLPDLSGAFDGDGDAAGSFTLENFDLYDTAEKLFGENEEWQKLPKEEIRTFCEELTEDLMVEAAGRAADYLLDGKEDAAVTPDDALAFIRRKEPDARQLLSDLGYTAAWELDYGKLREQLKEVMGEGIRFSALLPEVPEEVTTLRRLVSVKTVLLLFGASLLFLLLLLPVCLGDLSAVLPCVGVPLNLAGLLYCAAVGAGRLVCGLLTLPETVWSLADLLFTPMLIMGTVMAVTGIVLLVIRRVWKAREKRMFAA